MITKQDLERFQELLNSIHKKENGVEFKTDEIRIYENCISIWDVERRDWYYLTENLEWTVDYEHENLLTFK